VDATWQGQWRWQDLAWRRTGPPWAYGRDLHRRRPAGWLDPVIVRVQPKIRRLIQVLSRRNKNKSGADWWSPVWAKTAKIAEWLPSGRGGEVARFTQGNRLIRS